MEEIIKGAAEDVSLDELKDVCLGFNMILLATDGSEPAVAATQYAVCLAKQFGAKLAAIYVDDGMEKLQLPEETAGDDVWDGSNPSVKGLGIAKVLAERSGVEVDVAVIRGGIAKRIIKTADELNADLVVLGETGRTGLKRLGMGSIAETVIRGASKPVLVIKAD